MSNSLILVANIIVKEGKEEFLKQELSKLIETTKKEEGCIQYILQQNNENPRNFVFYEAWETRELWQEHAKNEHLNKYRQAVAREDAVELFEVKEMSVVI